MVMRASLEVMTDGKAMVPITTRGTALLHLNFLLTGIVMTFLGPMLPILASRWGMSDAVSGRLYLT